MATDLIRTPRLTLPVLDLTIIDTLLADPAGADFVVPPGWPDADDLAHLHRWRALAVADGGHSPWRARALVEASGTFAGHVGFHGPPAPITVALDDPTFVGNADPCAKGVVEIGYTILAPYRSLGYATEAVAGLIDWADATGRVGAVLACVRPDNGPSLAVLDRLGGFERIGRCQDGDEHEIVFRRDLA